MHRLLFIAFVFLSWLPPLVGQTPPTRILLLGDSITLGVLGVGPGMSTLDGFGGYRGTLGSLLTAVGYNVDFVGNQTSNGQNIPDPNHEGHSGWRIDMIDAIIDSWLASIADPDVVLMHIGTNDFAYHLATPTYTQNAINRLDALILKIATLRPSAHIIVTNLMERDDNGVGAPDFDAVIQSEFNPFVQARVNAHAAAGRRVTFLDMRAACPLSDMPDLLHPNQAGYNKMANAWLTAIEDLPPRVVLVATPDNTHVVVTFSKQIEDAGASLSNFSIAGLTIYGAVLDAATKRVVTLTTSPMNVVTQYTLAVTGVRDRTPDHHEIAPGTTANFYGPAVRGAVNNVPEAANYTLLYSLNLPGTATYNVTPPVYDIDNRNGIGPFTRVAYYLELQRPGQPLEFCWVSMDSFSSDLARLGVPHLASGASFQQTVASMNIASNVPGVVTGGGLSGGNIEFWPTNYGTANSGNVPGASGDNHDFGDEPLPGDYGSMQIHNYAAGQTLIAFNRWGNFGGNLDLGIGNRPTSHPDWTFAGNAAEFSVRALQVFVKTSDDFTGPALSMAVASLSRTKVTVTFSEPLSDSSAVAQNFALNAGATVLSATLRPNLREIVLEVTQAPPGVPLTLTVTGVRDRSPNANLIAPGANIPVTATAPTLPAIIANNVPEAADYALACRLDIPATQPTPSGGYNTNGTPYAIDNRADVQGFDRVAYFLELATGAASTHVWVSGDAFTTATAKIAVPDRPSGAFFQQALANMNVVSNSPGVATGTGLNGWLEFWPNDYGPANSAGVSGASDANFDFGDEPTVGGGGYYGSMQIHNPAAAQTLFAFNRWDYHGGAADLGIGNRPTQNPAGDPPDWTFAGNAGSYTTRTLYVLVRPNDTTPPTIATATSGAELVKVRVTFSEAVRESSANPSNFTLSGGLVVTAATRLADQRIIELTTTPQTAGTPYTLTVSGVTDSVGNAIAPGSTVNFTAVYSPPGPMVAPVFISHPTSRSVNAGTATTFLVAAAGTSPFSYQWRRNGAPIPGATGQTYTIANAQALSAAVYDVVVTNPAGAAQSLLASISVTGLTENPTSLSVGREPGLGDVIGYTASPNQPFVLQRSANLIQWDDVANVSADATGAVSFIDPNPPALPVYYRLRRINP